MCRRMPALRPGVPVGAIHLKVIFVLLDVYGTNHGMRSVVDVMHGDVERPSPAAEWPE